MKVPLKEKVPIYFEESKRIVAQQAAQWRNTESNHEIKTVFIS